MCHLFFGTNLVNYLYGIGKKTAEKLTRLGIHTLGQLAVGDDVLLSKHFGVMGAHLKRSANGIDPSAGESGARAE